MYVKCMLFSDPIQVAQIRGGNKRQGTDNNSYLCQHCTLTHQLISRTQNVNIFNIPIQVSGYSSILLTFPINQHLYQVFQSRKCTKKKPHMYWGLILFLLNNRLYSVSRHKRWPWHRSTLYTIPEPANQIILRSIIELSGQTRTSVIAFKTTWPLVHQPDFAFLVMVKIDWMLCTPLRWLVWMFVDKNFTEHQKHRFFFKNYNVHFKC